MKKAILPIITFFLGYILSVLMVKYDVYLPIKFQSLSQNTQTLRYIRPTNLPSNPIDTFFDDSFDVTIDFAHQIATGSPLIFGGVHAPENNQQDAWDKIQNVGVTNIRYGLNMEQEIPSNISLQDYRNNINDIQNPSKWNTKTINSRNDTFFNAKKRSMKVIGILIYSPSWLSYSGTQYGVPKDWIIFEDLVKKIYKIHRNYLDYIEIWNEPDLKSFLDLTNSNMTKEDAYLHIFYYASHAIREVDTEINDGKTIPIGAPAISNTINASFLETILNNPSYSQNIDFISYHNYVNSEPSWNNYLNILNKYNKSQLPIFLTEWNFQGTPIENQLYRSSDLAISYTGNKLIDFLKGGLMDANYYLMADINRPKYPYDNPSFAFYTWNGNETVLLPQAKTWMLLSKTLGLGKDMSKIYETINSADIDSVGFINSSGQKGLAIVNDSDGTKVINVTINNVIMKNSLFSRIDAKLYIADKDHGGATLVEESQLHPKRDQASFAISIPSRSVVGIILEENSSVWNVLR